MEPRNRNQREHSTDQFSRLTRSLIERAFEMRCQAYTAQAKHLLLIQTIMHIDASKRSVIKSNLQLKEFDRIKTMFIAGITHEINNPLASILGYSELIKRGKAGPLTEKQLGYLQGIITSAEHIKHVVTDAMDIAKIESNNIEVRIEHFNLAHAINDVMAVLQPLTEDKGIPINVTINEDLEIDSDRQRLIQCLINLVSNAIKYTEEGQITLDVRGENDMIKIAVSDTGIGLSDNDMENLFQAFRRGGSAVRSKAFGSGIGLFLTNKLVHNVLKGTISVQSELNKGSTFTLLLPRNITPNASPLNYEI